MCSFFLSPACCSFLSTTTPRTAGSRLFSLFVDSVGLAWIEGGGGGDVKRRQDPRFDGLLLCVRVEANVNYLCVLKFCLVFCCLTCAMNSVSFMVLFLVPEGMCPARPPPRPPFGGYASSIYHFYRFLWTIRQRRLLCFRRLP